MATQVPSVPMLAAGSRVVVVVSSGPPPAVAGPYLVMPELVGKPQGDALAQLQTAGFSAQVFNDYSETFKRGDVIGQLPLGGSSAASGAGAVLLISSGSSGTPVREQMLPELVGKPEADAVSTLQNAGFSPQIVREASASVPAGIVVAQVPSRASLAAVPASSSKAWVWAAVAAAVVVVALVAWFLLFKPAPTTTVPDLVGTTQEQAQQMLTAAGLTLGDITQTESKDAPEGTIAEQNPLAGSVANEGDAVDIVVSGGKPLVSVPDVRNSNQADATRALQEAGLQVSVTREPSNSVAQGLVIDQTPKGGQKVPEGTTVGIVISEGKEVTNVEVPDVTGETRSDAEKTLQDAGLKVAVAENPSDSVAKDIVAMQLPAAGESVAPGTTIGIVVSTGPPTAELVEVPNVVGLSLAEAQQVMSDAGFESQPIAGSGTGKPANEVVAQEPAAGDKVQGGSTVVLFYSTGP